MEADNNNNNKIDLLPTRSLLDGRKFGEKSFKKLKINDNSI